MTPDRFELTEAELRARRNGKWTLYDADVLPAWVAEMDFTVAPPVQAAIERLVRQQDYGYPRRNRLPAGEAVSNAFAAHMQRSFGWAIDPKLVVPLADLVQGTYAPVMAYTAPGDGIVLQMPAYPPFQEAIVSTGRRLIADPLAVRNGRYTIDFDALAGRIDATTRMLVLCNPQNPTGTVFTREELLRLADLAIAHDLIIVSDEIHGDLVHPGHRHIPIASLSPEIAARTVTLNSATKSFNIPGLRCAVVYFGTAALRDRFFKSFPRRMVGAPNIIGIDATVAAWTQGQPWLDEVLAHLGKVRDRVASRLRKELPEINFHIPEATYMAWLDCSKLGFNVTAADFFLQNAKLAFSPGETFDPASRQFIRFNFATSTAIADEILDRMVEAVKRARS
jgi:cystathionine beta-lyase